MNRFKVPTKETQRGSVITEMAFLLPLLVMVIFSSVEISRYVLLHQKIDRTASTMADLVTRSNDISLAELTDYFESANAVMQPFQLAAEGAIIVSSIYQEEDQAPRVNWQQTGGGTLSGITSLFGATNSNATLPENFIMNDFEAVITVEVFYAYQPWLFDLSMFGFTEANTIYHRAFFRPRLGDLSVLG